MFYCFRQYNETFARKLKNNQCTTVRQQTARYSLAHSSALFLYTFLHISFLHSFHVAPFVFLHVAFASCLLFLCCTHFVLHFFHITLFSSFTFLCRALFVLHFSVLHIFHFALFSCCTHLLLHLFHFALFSCRTFFRFVLFWCCTFCVLFSCCTFFVLYFFNVTLFSCWTFFKLQFSWCTVVIMHLFVCCTPFMRYLFSCFLMMHCNHVALFRHLAQQRYWKQRLHNRCFPGKSVKFLRSLILENIGERRLQKICSEILSIYKSHKIVMLQRMNGLKQKGQKQSPRGVL